MSKIIGNTVGTTMNPNKIADEIAPTFETAEIEGGHRITISDKDGVKAFDVMDGKDGKDGKDGDKGDKGEQGIPGEDGASGTHFIASAEKPSEVGVLWLDTDDESSAGGGGTAQPMEKLTFTGAVEAEYDGSEPVTVEIPQGGGGGGGIDGYKLVKTLTLAETVSAYEINSDNEGNPLSLNEVVLEHICPAATASPDCYTTITGEKGDTGQFTVGRLANSNSETRFIMEIKRVAGLALIKDSSAIPGHYKGNVSERVTLFDIGRVTKIYLRTGGPVQIQAGTIVKVYGRG